MKEMCKLAIELGVNNEKIVNFLENSCTILEADKGTTVLKTQADKRLCYIHLSGISRVVFVDKSGVESTEDFLYKIGDIYINSLIFPIYPLKKEFDDFVECQALTHIKYMLLHMEDVEKLCRKDNEFSLIVLSYYANMHYRNCKTRRMVGIVNAEERYKWFLRNYPYLNKKVPQCYIASFLHMSPEHLCRIKKHSNLDQ